MTATASAVPVAGRSRYQKERRYLIESGRWEPLTGAEPVREHLRRLAEAGIRWPRVAELSGVPGWTVKHILYGSRGFPPARRVRQETAAAILAVPVSLSAAPAAARVDAAGTRRRVEALAAAGWPQAEVAARLGMPPTSLSQVLHRRGQVSAATARAVADLYDELWDQAPPEGTRRERIASARARRTAAERGWAPPLAWDDAAIDDPLAAPAQGWQRKARRSPAELAAEARDLMSMGLSRRDAAERLGVTRAMVDTVLSRHPGCDEDDESEAA